VVDCRRSTCCRPSEEDILWVKAELDARRTPTNPDAFNVRLAEKGKGPISKGAFSRSTILNAATLHREWGWSSPS